LLSNVTGLTYGNVTATGLTLSWTAPQDMVGVQGYKIMKGTTQIGTASAGATSFSVTGLNPSTAYNFTITPYDAHNNYRSKSSINVSTIAP